MRLALFRVLSKEEQKKETILAIANLQKSYEELSNLGMWYEQPKDFPKKINQYIIWSKK